MSQVERDNLLARFGTGVDVRDVRRRNQALVGLIAIPLIAGLVLWIRSSQAATKKRSSYTREGLASAGFKDSDIDRINDAQRFVQASSAEFQVDEDLINGVIWVESRFKPKAISNVGAMGLMQLMPNTEAFLSSALNVPRQDPYDPAYNVRLGTYFLRRLLNRFDNNIDQVLASYNWGPGNVQQGKPWPKSVQSYVAAVRKAEQRFAQARTGAGTGAAVA